MNQGLWLINSVHLIKQVKGSLTYCTSVWLYALPFALPGLQLSSDDNLGKDISESGYLVFYFGGNMSERKSYWSSYKVSGQSKEIGAS